MAQKPGPSKTVIKPQAGQPAQPPKASNAPKRERPILRTVAVACVVLAVGFAAAWYYLQRQDKLRKQTAYSKPVEVSAAVKGYTMRLTFAVRITGADTDWASQNGAAIESAMKEAMTTVRPPQLATPDDMKQFQDRVRSSANAKLNTDKVQDVVVTDYLYASEE
jgi:flagellar basal body-associated protein FliL